MDRDRREVRGDDHPGPAERHDHRGRRVRRLGSARPRDEPERGRERQGPRRGRTQGGCARDPRLVHRRAGRDRPEAERAAVPGRQGRQRARTRHVGRRACRGTRAAGRRPCRREDADERLLRHEARHPPARTRRRDADRHRCLDEHVDRAHGATRRGRGLPPRRRLGRHLDRRRRMAERGALLRDDERRLGRDLAEIAAAIG